MMLTENSFSLASTLIIMIKDFLESIEELCLQERAERLTYHVLLHHLGTQCLADRMGFIYFFFKIWRGENWEDSVEHHGKAKNLTLEV